MPDRLMERLALVSAADDRRGIAQGYREPGVVMYFGYGLFGGAAAGGLLLALLSTTVPIERGPAAVPPAIAALAPWMPAPEPGQASAKPAPAKTPEAPPLPPTEVFDVRIDRAMRSSAPFGLRLLGSGDTQGVEVVLHDVPPAVVLSSGTRRDAATWSLGAADLEHLRLTIADGSPDAFDVRINVLAPSGIVQADTIARVRVVDMESAERKAPAPAETEPAAPLPPRKRVARADTPVSTRAPARSWSTASTTVREKAPRAEPHTSPVEVATAQPEPLATTQTRHWPEGASGLGAVPRVSERQVWWKLPAPSWSPFQDTAGDTR